MHIVYVGPTMHSIWDSRDKAEREAGILRNAGKDGVTVKTSTEFQGYFPDGFHF
jgi:hypothetical protein